MRTYTMPNRKFKPFVTERFHLNDKQCNHLMESKYEFGYDGFGEAVFYRTYSRVKEDGFNENWPEVIVRVTNGLYSIVKDYYTKNHLEWVESYWQNHANNLSQSMFEMKWLPPGRGLFSMGSNYMYERGSVCLFNCAFVKMDPVKFGSQCNWIADLLMNGVGVGFEVQEDLIKLWKPIEEKFCISIDDTREGWAESIESLINSYLTPNNETLVFDYSRIRKRGLPIKGYGGLSSGPKPLMWLHNKIREFCGMYLNRFNRNYTCTQLYADIVNCIGCCVVAGNVRRSAQMCISSINNEVFLNLKRYDIEEFKYRSEFGWMSNNAVKLAEHSDFDKLGDIAEGIKLNGDPGYVNLINTKYGRIGKDDGLKLDKATGLNPCGEMCLESGEICNIAETFPTICNDQKEWYGACRNAAFYCYAIYLMDTHRPEINKIIKKNRRIGVGMVDFSGWKHEHGVHKITRWMRNAYKEIRDEVNNLANEWGTPEPIKVTTIKPGGSVPKIAGKTAGKGYPNSKYMIRRMRVQEDSPYSKFLSLNGMEYEKAESSMNTVVFSWPIICGPARPVYNVSLWEQAMDLVLLQREWADNAVSNTLMYKPKWKCIRKLSKKIEQILEGYKVEDGKLYQFDPRHEEDDIEAVLSAIAPLVKSVSLLPIQNEGVYEQMPEECITEEKYNELVSKMKKIDWKDYKGSDGVDEKFCSGDKCEANL